MAEDVPDQCNFVRRSIRKVSQNSYIKQRNAKIELREKIKKVSQILRKPEHERTCADKALVTTNPDAVKTSQKNEKRRQDSKDRLLEIEDEPAVLAEKCANLAELIRSSEHVVVYTGAGISTAASIPDYRGPNGVWTLLKKGQELCPQDLSDAEPTYTHMSLTKLFREKKVKYVVSQNCDGLHMRSGFPRYSLSELHGNMYIEMCYNCAPHREFVRLFDVTEHTRVRRHTTGRRCKACGVNLCDTIVHFGEKGKIRSPYRWKEAVRAAKKADLILCLGSSLKVLKKYACLWCMDQKPQFRPKLAIVNLQWTPKDDVASLKINGRCDNVMRTVMGLLEYDVPDYRREFDPIFRICSPLRANELKTTNKKILIPPEQLLKPPRQSSKTKTKLKDSSDDDDDDDDDDKIVLCAEWNTSTTTLHINGAQKTQEDISDSSGKVLPSTENVVTPCDGGNKCSAGNPSSCGSLSMKTPSMCPSLEKDMSSSIHAISARSYLMPMDCSPVSKEPPFPVSTVGLTASNCLSDASLKTTSSCVTDMPMPGIASFKSDADMITMQNATSKDQMSFTLQTAETSPSKVVVNLDIPNSCKDIVTQFEDTVNSVPAMNTLLLSTLSSSDQTFLHKSTLYPVMLTSVAEAGEIITLPIPNLDETQSMPIIVELVDEQSDQDVHVHNSDKKEATPMVIEILDQPGYLGNQHMIQEETPMKPVVVELVNQGESLDMFTQINKQQGISTCFGGHFLDVGNLSQLNMFPESQQQLLAKSKLSEPVSKGIDIVGSETKSAALDHCYSNGKNHKPIDINVFVSGNGLINSSNDAVRSSTSVDSNIIHTSSSQSPSGLSARYPQLNKMLKSSPLTSHTSKSVINKCLPGVQSQTVGSVSPRTVRPSSTSVHSSNFCISPSSQPIISSLSAQPSSSTPPILCTKTSNSSPSMHLKTCCSMSNVYAKTTDADSIMCVETSISPETQASNFFTNTHQEKTNNCSSIVNIRASNSLPTMPVQSSNPSIFMQTQTNNTPSMKPAKTSSSQATMNIEAINTNSLAPMCVLNMDELECGFPSLTSTGNVTNPKDFTIEVQLPVGCKLLTMDLPHTSTDNNVMVDIGNGLKLHHGSDIIGPILQKGLTTNVLGSSVISSTVTPFVCDQSKSHSLFKNKQHTKDNLPHAIHGKQEGINLFVLESSAESQKYENHTQVQSTTVAAERLPLSPRSYAECIPRVIPPVATVDLGIDTEKTKFELKNMCCLTMEPQSKKESEEKPSKDQQNMNISRTAVSCDNLKYSVASKKKVESERENMLHKMNTSQVKRSATTSVPGWFGKGLGIKKKKK